MPLRRSHLRVYVARPHLSAEDASSSVCSSCRLTTNLQCRIDSAPRARWPVFLGCAGGGLSPCQLFASKLTLDTGQGLGKLCPRAETGIVKRATAGLGSHLL